MITRTGRAIIIAGGEMHTTPIVDSGDIVLAADSGYDHARAVGAHVDVLVGDLDSISTTGLNHAHSNGIHIQQHPSDKDETDLELAMRIAVDRGASSIMIHGGEDGRIAHLLTIALSLANPLWAAIDVAWHTRTGVVRTATQGHVVAFTCAIGDTVSLVPVGRAGFVTTHGLRWALSDSVLETGSSLGVSNEAISNEVHVEAGSGTVLVIHEGEPTQ